MVAEKFRLKKTGGISNPVLEDLHDLPICIAEGDASDPKSGGRHVPDLFE